MKAPVACQGPHGGPTSFVNLLKSSCYQQSAVLGPGRGHKTRNKTQSLPQRTGTQSGQDFARVLDWRKLLMSGPHSSWQREGNSRSLPSIGAIGLLGRPNAPPHPGWLNQQTVVFSVVEADSPRARCQAGLVSSLASLLGS